MSEKFLIDTSVYEPLTEGGLRPPQLRLSGMTPSVQEHVRAAFGPMLPAIVTDHDGAIRYENLDRSRRNTVAMSRELKEDESWPSHELLRLLQGWQNLQAIAEGIAEQNLKLFLLCFQLPHPEQLRDRYRLYRDSSGKVRMHVLWGFFPIGARHLSLPVDQVLALLKVNAPKRSQVATATEALVEAKPERKTWFVWPMKKA